MRVSDLANREGILEALELALHEANQAWDSAELAIEGYEANGVPCHSLESAEAIYQKARDLQESTYQATMLAYEALRDFLGEE